MNNKDIDICGYCQQKTIAHIHTDGKTYAINGFPDNEETKKAFNTVCQKINAYRENNYGPVV